MACEQADRFDPASARPIWLNSQVVFIRIPDRGTLSGSQCLEVLHGLWGQDDFVSHSGQILARIILPVNFVLLLTGSRPASQESQCGYRERQGSLKSLALPNHFPTVQRTGSPPRGPSLTRPPPTLPFFNDLPPHRRTIAIPNLKNIGFSDLWRWRTHRCRK